MANNGDIFDKTDKKPSVWVHPINQKRLVNVLFSDTIRQLFASRSVALTKDDLTNGFKTDKLIHCAIVKEYNNPELHNKDHYPHLKLTSQCYLQDKPIIWMQSKKYLAIIAKEYEEVFRNFKKSGNHGDFGDSNGDNDFESVVKINQLLLYLHEFVQMYPDI